MKVAKRIIDIVSTVLVIIVVVLALLLVGVRLVGLQPFVVLSGSMEPIYSPGDMIYVKEVAPETVKVGDPITFVLNEDLDVATHTVVQIDEVEQLFYTKGEANEAVDGEPVHFNNLIGVPVFHLPYLGYVSNYVTTPPGMYLAIAGIIILVILMFVPDILKAMSKEEKTKKDESLDKDKPGDDGVQPEE